MTTKSDLALLPRCTPEAQGIASSALLALLDEAEQVVPGLHSLMLLRHGSVVAEGWWTPYQAGQPHMLFSLSKSFTSTAAGLLIGEGRLSLDDPVLNYFSQDQPAEVSENLKAMRVRHLLSMSTGHAEDTLGPLFRRDDGNWARAFLSQPVEYTPGTHFLYNSGATYMVSAIVQTITGETVLNYLEPRLLTPLCITGATWENCPRGINAGGWGLSVKTEDIARFGQLYLQKGIWNDQRLLPEGWVEEATAKHISNGDNPDSDWNQGYGFQFWRCRHGIYRGDGAFGQYCVVMPAQDTVVAITGGLSDMQAVLNVLWKHLLPALGPAPLPEDPAAADALRGRLACLELRRPSGQQSSALAAQISGRTYCFPENDQKIESMKFDFGRGETAVYIRNSRGDHRIGIGSDASGAGTWVRGETALETLDPRPVAAAGAWTAEDTFSLQLCYTETPFCPVITCRFEEDQMMLDYHANVSFGPAERPRLTGRVDPGKDSAKVC